MNAVIIGIAGGTASGKTTIANRVNANIQEKNSVVLIKIDDYYKEHDDLPFTERTKINYDHPNAYDIKLLSQHLKDLKAGKRIEKPIYDFVKHNRIKTRKEIIEPANVIIIEGILTLAIKEIRELCDIKLYVDTPDDIRFIRRLKRDIEARGRSLDSVIAQYLTTVRPMHETFVEPSKVFADLIIPEGGNNRIAIEFIVTRIMDFMHNGKREYK